MKAVKLKQRDITDCGAACLASVSGYYGMHVTISRVRQLASTDKKGTNILGLIEAANILNFDAKGVRGNPDSLSKIPKPAIAHVVIDKVLHHYVVIYEVNPISVTVMDPQDGELHVYSFAEFGAIWTGVLIILLPNENFANGNYDRSIKTKLILILRQHKRLLAFAAIAAFIYTIIGVSTSIYIQAIIDIVLVKGDRDLLRLSSVIMLILLLIQAIAGAAKNVFSLRTGQMIDNDLILGYYKHLIRLPKQFFDSMRLGEITSRINDAVKVRTFINDAAINILVNIFVLIFSIALMLMFYWRLALIILLVLPLYYLIYFLINQRNKRVERKLMEKRAIVESQLVESISSISTIKCFSLENYMDKTIELKFTELSNTVNKSGINSIVSATSTESVSKLFTVILLWTGALFVIQKEITAGELLSFYALFAYFTIPVNALIGANKTYQNAIIAGDRLFEIMDLQREISSGKIKIVSDNLGDIQFEAVEFRYGSRVNVFTDLSLIIPQGKITVIVGESGSGKSTLISIIQNLYPIQSGSVRIGLLDIQEIDQSSLRKTLGIVPQKIDLFPGDIIDNIAVGEYQPDVKKITQICRELGMLSFIEGLPNGFRTYLGENGTNLSGGQRQRLAIARALYKDPDILMLDEATSSLDNESEQFVQNVLLQQRMLGKTIIVITHRLKAVVCSDNVVLLSLGKVIANGPHEVLMRTSEYYRSVWSQEIPAAVIKELASNK